MGCGTIAALGLMGAGTGMQIAGNKKSGDAMNSAANNEKMRQQGFLGENLNTFHNSLDQSRLPAANQQIQQGTQAVAGQTTGMSTPQVGAVGGYPSMNTSLTNRASGAANAGLQGYGNYGFQQGLKDTRAEGQLGVTNQLSQNSLAPLNAEIGQASHRGDTLGGIGSLLGTAGSLLGLSSMKAPKTAQLPGVPSQAQMQGLTGGYGPLAGGYAAQKFDPIMQPFQMNATFGTNPQMDSWMTNPYGMYGF